MSVVVFWIVGALLIAAIAAIFSRALRSHGTAETSENYDIAVYRDQLAEVDRDVARGVLSNDDAATVRTEVSRRLLAADKVATHTAVQGPTAIWPIAAMVVTLAIGSVGGYHLLGATGYGDVPLSKRLADAQEYRDNRPSQSAMETTRVDPGFPADTPQDVIDLVDKLRIAVADRPDDLRGAELLARQEANFGNFIAASAAQTRVVALKAEAVEPVDLAQQAFYMINAAGGQISAEAEAVLIALLNKDPQNPLGIYYSGLMFAQADRPDMAFRLWRGLIESDAQNPFVDLARANIGEAAFLAGVDYTPPAPFIRGPSAEDIQAAEDLSPEERQSMIANMISGLENRLATEGGTPAEWAQLIRAYGILGDTARANVIWSEAKTVFDGNESAMTLVRQAAHAAGVIQ